MKILSIVLGMCIAISVAAESLRLTLKWKEGEKSSRGDVNWHLKERELQTMFSRLGKDPKLISSCATGLWGGTYGYRIVTNDNAKKVYWQISCSSIDEHGKSTCQANVVSKDELNGLGWPIQFSGNGVRKLDLTGIDASTAKFFGGEKLYLEEISRDGPFDVLAIYQGCHCRQVLRYTLDHIGKGPGVTEDGEMSSMCI